MVQQQRHAADVLSMYAHKAYHHNHPETTQIAAQCTHAQYQPKSHHQTVHTVPSIRLRSLELLADKNS
jgi:hypothetical protein